MHKKQIERIVKFYETDGVIYYLLSTDGHQGYIEVDIEERENETDVIYTTKGDQLHLWDYLEDCNFDDFRFYKKVDIFKEDLSE